MIDILDELAGDSYGVPLAAKQRAIDEIKELRHVVGEFYRAICRVRSQLSPEVLECVNEWDRGAIDLALVHAQRLIPQLKSDR